MLLDGNRGDSVLRRTASALRSSIRETDVAGWYKHRCIGVIFAEIGDRDKGIVIDTLRARTTEALRSSLEPDELARVRLSFYWFPDESMKQPVVNLLNASVKWTNRSRRYDLRLWGANLTGAEYYSFGSETIAYGQQFSPEPPRTFGITAGMHF